MKNLFKSIASTFSLLGTGGLCVGLLCLLFTACVHDEENKSDDSYVNDWISDVMQTYYYWNEQIPSNVNREQYPATFFHSLLYKSGQPDGDRFSWIQENYRDLMNSLSGVSAGDLGFEMLMHRVGNTNDLIGEVLYVKPGTQAQAKGVKRGDAFDAIDGATLNTSNYTSLLQRTSPNIRFAIPAIENGNLVLKNPRTVSLTATNYTENPIFLDTIYTINDKTIGYLIYNFFASDAGNDSAEYDKQLNAIFGKFKTAGINNLVVDLRYNSGGSTECATRLASMMVRHLDTSNLFYILRYNQIVENHYGQERVSFVSKFENVNLNNVGDNLQKIYFITSMWSASASEMLINGLRPYMQDDIVVVGDITVGKSYASAPFYEEDDARNKWALLPLIAKYTNGAGNEVPMTGMIPDYPLTEYSELPKQPLGDVSEILLNKALSEITGAPLRSAAAMTTPASLVNRPIISTSVTNKAYSNRTILNKRK